MWVDGATFEGQQTMKLDAKVKGGLAWAGLIVILAVPAADILFGQQGASSATANAAVTTAETAGKPGLKLPVAKPAVGTDPVQTASTGESAPVDNFLKSRQETAVLTSRTPMKCRRRPRR